MIDLLLSALFFWKAPETASSVDVEVAQEEVVKESAVVVEEEGLESDVSPSSP